MGKSYIASFSLQGVAQFGRVPALEAGCRRFKSCHPDFIL